MQMDILLTSCTVAWRDQFPILFAIKAISTNFLIISSLLWEIRCVPHALIRAWRLKTFMYKSPDVA
jgi:hypothetical protein